MDCWWVHVELTWCIKSTLFCTSAMGIGPDSASICKVNLVQARLASNLRYQAITVFCLNYAHVCGSATRADDNLLSVGYLLQNHDLPCMARTFTSAYMRTFSFHLVTA